HSFSAAWSRESVATVAYWHLQGLPASGVRRADDPTRAVSRPCLGRCRCSDGCRCVGPATERAAWFCLMLFPTTAFLIFFVAVAIGLAALQRSYEAQKIWLVLASYFFYAQWNWRFCFLLAFSSTVTYIAGLALERVRTQRSRKRVVAATVTVHLLTLGFFKYFD